MSERSRFTPGTRLTPPVDEQDHQTGPDTASVSLVEFGDFECPYCAQAYPIVEDLQTELGDQLRLVYRHFPLTNMHEHAQQAAEASEAAGAQEQFWELYDRLYEQREPLTEERLIEAAGDIDLDTERLSDELTARTHREAVREDFLSGVRSGVNGTPTFFIDGQRHENGWDHETLLGALQDVLD